jgi:aspartate/methionine/tyrosine aminotransferase
MSSSYPIEPRSAIANLSASKIREVANAGIGRADVLPFWFGEPDEVTPQFIRDAASAALAAGATFYTSNLGIVPLREAIARYQSGLHGPIDSSRVVVTSSGMSALMIAMQTLISPGDRVVVVTPVWPNLTEGPRILGAQLERVALDCVKGHWQLDLEKLLCALTDTTRLLLLNSPNNPTGWVISREEQQAILEHCRRRGIWIVGDDVYERIVFDPALRVASSFLDIAEPDDRVVSTNSFSKAWLMTGWRLGWLISPRSQSGATLTEQFAKLIEYNTSCAPDFVQQAAVVALDQGDAVIARTVERYRVARDHLCALLAPIRGLTLAPPAGAMYLFFRIEGERDSLALCKRLVTEVGLGIAPGAAFGPEGEGYVRWCIASSLPRLDEGAARLARFLDGAGRRAPAR